MRDRSLLAVLAAAALLTTIASAAPPNSAEELMRRVEARFRSLEDYQATAELQCRKGSKSEEGLYQIWFKQPQLLRVKVLKGRSRGSDVVVDRAGTIRGRKGGLLKPFVVRLKPNDSRLCSLTGMPVTQFDLGRFCRRYWELSARPGAKAVLTPPRAESSPFEITLTYPEAGAQMREIIRVDPALMAVEEAEIHRDGVRTDRVVFRDVRFNTGVEEKVFRL